MQPRKTARVTRRKVNNEALSISNQFQNLSQIEGEENSTQISMDNSIVETTSPNLNSTVEEASNKQNSKGRRGTTSPMMGANVKSTVFSKRKNYCVPIYIYDMSMKDIAELFKANDVNKEKFYLRYIDEKSILAKCDNTVTSKTVIEILKKNKVKFYTYTTREEKPRNLIIKGIRGNFTADDLRSEIKSLNIANVNITKLEQINLY